MLINPVVWPTHEVLGHFGPRKVFSFLRDFVYWPRISRGIKRLLRACDLCQKTKYPNKHFRGKRHSITSRDVGELVAVDFFRPLPTSIRGVTYTFVAVDVFSNYTRLFAMRRATARAAVKCMIRDVCATIPVRTVLSDHGTQFTSKIWRTLLEEAGLRVTYSSIQHSRFLSSRKGYERDRSSAARLLP